MFKTVTPEQAGISSAHVERFLRKLNQRGLVTHSVLLMRGNDIFGEFYWKPFHKDFNHRQYSQTKSFVGVAIGLLEQDGLLSLDDTIASHFPEKVDRELPLYLQNQTIRHMLTMQTCGNVPYWFTHDDPDRTHAYLKTNTAHLPSGMRWEYDSAGSQVLSSLVEKLSGDTLFGFLDKRIFRKLGTFRTASILKTKNGDSWGDSAMLCTARDMASFGRFVMNYGKWNGEQILNEAYLRQATAPLVSNDTLGFASFETGGYGYQIWSKGDEMFFFNGMGCQLTLCLPGKDLIFAISGDNQGFPAAKALIEAAFQDNIVDNLGDTPLPEDPDAYASCCRYGQELALAHLSGKTASPFAAQLSGRRYRCAENPTGITEFSLHFTAPDAGELHYTNAQGEKVLPFGLGKNVFCKFPQLGYSNLYGGIHEEDGFLYGCAASAAWREERKLLLKVQVIDNYFGNMLATFSFRDDTAVVTMVKTAEDFLNEYTGTFTAKCI